MTQTTKTLMWGLLFSITLAGCAEITSFRAQTPEDSERLDLDDHSMDTEYIGKMITIAGTQSMEVKGVALVSGLDGPHESAQFRSVELIV